MASSGRRASFSLPGLAFHNRRPGRGPNDGRGRVDARDRVFKANHELLPTPKGHGTETEGGGAMGSV